MSKNHNDFINIPGLLKNYRSKWYLFAISIICCLLVGFVATRVFKQKYGVRANILIQQEENSPLSAMGSLGDLIGSSGNVDDEIFVISSHSLYRQVVRDLGINCKHYVRHGFLNSELTYPDYPLDVTPAAGIIDTLRTGLNFKIKVDEDGFASIKLKDSYKDVLGDVKNVKLPYTFKTKYGDFTVDRTQHYPVGEAVTSTVTLTGYHAAAESLAEDISCDIAAKRSNVISLAINTTNAEMGEAILTDLVKRYNDRGIEEKNIQGVKTAEFIADRLEKLGTSLSEDEIEMQKYKESKGVINLQQEIAYQSTNHGQVETVLIEAETQLEILRMLKDFMADESNKYELIPISTDNEGLATAINLYNESLIKRNHMLQTVNPGNIALEKLTQNADAKRMAITKSINQAYNNAEVVVRDLKGQMASTASRLGDVPDQERYFLDSNRESHIKAQLYMFLLRRQEENAMMLANATPKGIVVDEAYVLAKPIGMSKKLILLIFLFIGICLPPVFLYILKLLRNRPETRDEIERRVNVPILGEMCIDNSGRSMVVTPTDTSSTTELFRLMRANLLFFLSDPKDKVVLLTSSKSGEGKSFISINLAATLALLGKKVLLVGMDVRAPKLASYLGIQARNGLTNYLSSSNVNIDDIIVNKPFAEIPSIDVIVAGPVPPNPAELLTTDRVDALFDELRGRYDYIVVDSAPVGLVSDTFTLDRIADATIYVTRLNYTTNSDVDSIEEIYYNKRLKKMSIVVNGVKSRKTYGYRAQKGQAAY